MQRMSAHVMFEEMNQPTRFLAFEFFCSARRLASHKACWFVFPTTELDNNKNVSCFIRDIPTSEPYISELPSSTTSTFTPAQNIQNCTASAI
jgi:hypothetical protein